MKRGMEGSVGHREGRGELWRRVWDQRRKGWNYGGRCGGRVGKDGVREGGGGRGVGAVELWREVWSRGRKGDGERKSDEGEKIMEGGKVMEGGGG